MKPQAAKTGSYTGFEQGPIRPPSEARSLLIRVTRNCPWNRCIFCPVYKGAKFSIRPVEHVRRDIDCVHEWVQTLLNVADTSGRVSAGDVRKFADDLAAGDYPPFAAALHWLRAGRTRSVFLQDANSLAVRAGDLVEILTHLKARFPTAERITSYARSQTITSKKDDDLKSIRDAGLDRIHIGLESGCDGVLAMVNKGATKGKHVLAGLQVKDAGMELSEYVMPGLGGQPLSEVHALETADALNRINPDFIRIRTLAIPPHTPLFDEWRAGRFAMCTDLMIVRELMTFIENLEGITSTVKSDHILNLFEDLEGTLPHDKERMLSTLRTFLAMDPHHQSVYQLGRRLGILRRIRDLENRHKMDDVERAYRELEACPENVDRICQELMIRYL